MARISVTLPGAGGTRKPIASHHGMSPPIITWPRDTGVERTAIACPNCGSDSPKPLLLTIEFTTSPGSRKETRVVRCPSCGCPFYAEQIPPDYAEDAMLGRGRVTFYLQQGAGLSLITRPLAQLRAPAGGVYAEIGCGFGFGLDYARHAKHWSGRGIDPGGIASLGQHMLGVTIERRYLGDAEPELACTCDVVMASETIEHVLSPIGFVRVLRSMLRPGGTLILTTPDGADLRPETAPGVLIGLLSPGLHLIFQTADSLRRILTEAGFGHVVLNKDGHSLVAFASDRPVELQTDGAVLKAEYRTWLEQRAAGFAPGDDLFFGFAGRALMEAVNDAAFDQAHRVRARIEQACSERFGQSLEALGEATSALQGMSLEDLTRRIPLNLGGLLYADAILRLASETERAGLGKRFLAAAAAADLLRIALADLAMADGMSEEIAWTARAEAVLCAAAAGADDILDQLSALKLAPDAAIGAARLGVAVERTLWELVNAGHYGLAVGLIEAALAGDRDWAVPDVSAPWSAPRSGSQRDALLAIERILVERVNAGHYTQAARLAEATRFDGRPGADPDVAACQRGSQSAALAALRAASRRDALFAIERILVERVNAGDYSQAAALVEVTGIDARDWADPAVSTPRSDSQRDALFCLAILDSQSAERAVIERSRDRFSRIRQMLETPHGHGGPPGLYEAATRGEVAADERLAHLDAADPDAAHQDAAHQDAATTSDDTRSRHQSG
jgi:SAM-dependent methyltransferase